MIIKVRNIYLSNYRIRNRPPGNAPSYASIRDGEVFDSVGYRPKSKSRATTTLVFDMHNTTGAAWPSSAFISPR